MKFEGGFTKMDKEELIKIIENTKMEEISSFEIRYYAESKYELNRKKKRLTYDVEWGSK